MELSIKNSDEADGTNSTEQAQLPRMWQKKKKKIFTLVQMYNPTVIKEAEEEEEGADIIICTSEKDEEFPLFRFVTVKVPDFFFFLLFCLMPYYLPYYLPLPETIFIQIVLEDLFTCLCQ